MDVRRRTVLAALGGAGTAVLGGCTTNSSVSPTQDDPGSDEEPIPAGSWPQVGYDAQNTQYQPHASGPREEPTIAWRALGGRAVYPPVVDEALYLAEAWTDGAALALDPATGTEQWTTREVPPSRWAPAIQEERLFVLTRERGNVVRLHALEMTTGEEVWRRQNGITASSGEHPPISPTVRNGTVYVASNRGVLACTAASGDIEWTAELAPHVIETDNGPTWRTDWAKPAVTADRVITFDRNENYQATREVYAVDRTSGELDWTAELETADGWYLNGHAVAGETRVYLTAAKPFAGNANGIIQEGASRLFALDIATGEVVWSWDRETAILTYPAYTDGTVYVGVNDPTADTQRLRALDASEGTSTWTVKRPDAVATPTVTNETVYIGHGETLTAINRADGAHQWEIGVGDPADTPVIVGETAYVRTAPGHNSPSEVLALRTDSG